MSSKPATVFDPRDPRWKTCREGCRPAAGMHRLDCPNVLAGEMLDPFSAKRLYPGLTTDKALARIRRLRDA